jgi:hypothetical protein
MGLQEDRQRILQMLAKGSISVEEADQLLSSLQARETHTVSDAAMGDHASASQSAGTATSGSGSSPNRFSAASTSGSAFSRTNPPKYLRVVVEPKGQGDRVNIRVPFQLLRAGAKLTALLPENARTHVNDKLQEKGINLDLNKITANDLESLMDHLSELTVDVDGQDETVRIFCE